MHPEPESAWTKLLSIWQWRKYRKYDEWVGLWLRSWLWSIFLHLPWIICFGAFWLFIKSPQGLSLREYPVEHMWAGYACLSIVLLVGFAIFYMIHIAESRRIYCPSQG